jgi:hypothetical protein
MVHQFRLLLVLAGLHSFGCAHTQPPERKIYVISEPAHWSGASDGPGIGGAGAEAYCGEVQNTCFRQCWERAPRFTSIRKGSAEHHRDCTSVCLEEFMRCIKEQEGLERQTQKQELRFPHIDDALSWLRAHKTQVAVGTIVLIAGVAFVVATSGAGALVLAPLAL